MAYNNPTVDDFKAYFVRDWPYSSDPNLGVMDADITSAYTLVLVNMNPALWANQGNYTVGFLYLAAHYMVLNLRASSQGLNGQYNWVQNSKTVQGVTEAFTIPQRLIDNPFFMMLTKTNYGARFFELVLPQLSGQVFSVYGRTRA